MRGGSDWTQRSCSPYYDTFVSSYNGAALIMLCMKFGLTIHELMIWIIRRGAGALNPVCV